MTNILGVAEATDTQACYWALGKGAPLWFACPLAQTYWRLAPLVGVRPEVAYAQAAHETGFGHFGRAVTKEHHNYCGLKVASPVGPDDNPDDHMRFPTPEVGVQAHLDHLALYAMAPTYPRIQTPDPRHFTWIPDRYGTTTVEGLSGGWAPSSTYHVKIVQFIDQIKAQEQ